MGYFRNTMSYGSSARREKGRQDLAMSQSKLGAATFEPLYVAIFHLCQTLHGKKWEQTRCGRMYKQHGHRQLPLFPERKDNTSSLCAIWLTHPRFRGIGMKCGVGTDETV
jgi:hypothetical protein